MTSTPGNAHSRSKRSYVLIAVLILIILVLVGLLLWRERNQDMTRSAKSTDISTESDDPKTAFTLDSSKLPKDWVIEVSDANDIILKNDITKCYTDVLYTTNVPQSAAASTKSYRQNVEGFKSQGYAVTEAASRLSIMTKGGTQQIDAHQLSLSGQANPAFKEYAYTTQPTSFVSMILSCPARSDIVTAEQALGAITFYKY